MLVSIIIPVYNKEKYLNDSIQSAINQDHDDLEIIIINDGSQDNSESIIKNWSLKDSRVKYIFQENEGVSSARNKGISIANGKYIFFLDADDFLERNSISKLVYYAEEEKVDIIIGNIYEQYVDSIIKRARFENRLLDEKDLSLFKTKLEMFVVNGRHMAMAGNKLYKLDFIIEHQIVFLDGVIAEDRLFNLMCYINNPVIQLANEYTYIYNILDNSRSSTFNSSYYDESISLINSFYDYLKNKSCFEQNLELFQLIVIYDVNRILTQTFKYSSQKIVETNTTIKRLRKNYLINETVSRIITQRKFKSIENGQSFYRMYLICYFLLKAPYLIVIYKIIGYLNRRIKLKLFVKRRLN